MSRSTQDLLEGIGVGAALGLIWAFIFAGIMFSRPASPAEFTCDQAKFWLGHFSAATLEQKAKDWGVTITAADRAKAAQCMHAGADVAPAERTRGGAVAARPVHTRKAEGASPSPASFHKHAKHPVDADAPVPAEALAPVVAEHEPEINSTPLVVTLEPVVVQAPVFEPPAPLTTNLTRTKTMLTTEHLLVLFALIGAGTFAYLVYAKGLVPAVQKVLAWWNTARADVTSVEARLVALERKVASFNTGPALAAAPAQAVPSTAAPTGASPAAAAPSPTVVA